jgi:hypothetical protein
MLAILACGIIIMCVFRSQIVLTMDNEDNDSNENYLVYGLQKSSSSSSFSSSKLITSLSQELWEYHETLI